MIQKLQVSYLHLYDLCVCFYYSWDCFKLLMKFPPIFIIFEMSEINILFLQMFNHI